MIDPGVGDDQESGLLEGLLDLIGQAAGREAAEDRSCSSVSSELKTFAFKIRYLFKILALEL